MSAIIQTYGEDVNRVWHYTLDAVHHFCEPSLMEEIDHHLLTMPRSKGVRPALVFAAAIASNTFIVEESSLLAYEKLIHRASAVELVHRAALAIDDMIDNSGMRSGLMSLCAEYGYVRAGCAAAELNLLAEHLLDSDEKARFLLREVGHKVAVAEALQDKLSDPHRQKLMPIITWCDIALGDTGSFFRLALELGGFDTRSTSGEAFVRSLAYLRHGLDDIEDLIEAGGDRADVRQGVPTLLTCFTKGTRLAELRKAIPQAFSWLKGSLDYYPNPEAFEPFMKDFAAKFKELEDLYEIAMLKASRKR